VFFKSLLALSSGFTVVIAALPIVDLGYSSHQASLSIVYTLLLSQGSILC